MCHYPHCRILYLPHIVVQVELLTLEFIRKYIAYAKLVSGKAPNAPQLTDAARAAIVEGYNEVR